MGPLVTLTTVLLAMTLGVLPVNDAFVVGALVVPVVCVINAVVSPWRRYWLGAALGAVLGSLLALAFIISAISAVAFLVSDPAP